MAATLQDLGIDRWPLDDRRVLLTELRENIEDEIIGGPPPEVIAKLRDRLAAADADPEGSIPSAVAFADLPPRTPRS